jgi:hypothetical protein
MKKFIVNFSYEMTGNIEVKAKNQKEAEKILLNDLDFYGLDGLWRTQNANIDYSSREFEII